MFTQVHPIVFQYQAIEEVFNAKPFRRYVFTMLGKPKIQADQDRMKKDRKFPYHYKSAQQGLYYKYLLIETNSNINKNTIYQMYEEFVLALNAGSDRMLDTYAIAEKEAEILEDQFTDEKRQDVQVLLNKHIQKTE